MSPHDLSSATRFQAGQDAVYCSSLYGSEAPTVENNDALSAGASGFVATFSGQSYANGNISVSPQFGSASRLKGGSPAIDSGNNLAPNLPTKDLANDPRIINGNHLSTAIVDMGAYEFVPVVLVPTSLGFGLQAVGNTMSTTVKLTNAQNKALNLSSYTMPTGYSVSGCGSSIAAFTSCTLTITFHPLTSGTFKGSLIVTDDAGTSPQKVALSGSAH